MLVLASISTLLWSVLLPSARADDPLSLDTSPLVYVAPFQAQNKEAAALAQMLPDFLTRSLDGLSALRAVGLEGIGFVHDTPADVYAASCPPGQYIGCAFVMAEAAGADYALASAVRAGEQGAQVELHIVDVKLSEELVSFQVDLGVGDDQAFAEGVGRVLLAVVEGEAGRSRDIREAEVADDGDAQNQAVSRELDALGAEIGDVTTLDTRGGREVERPRFTVADLVQEQSTDATKPWERLAMKPREYLRYRNSGLSLIDWRDRARGRKGQLVVRVQGGFGRGPVDGSYYSKYLRNTESTITGSYSWQSAVDASGVSAGAAVGYGLRPDVELGVVGGFAKGRYSAVLEPAIEGETSYPLDAEEFANTSVFAGPQVVWAPLPTSVARPVVGGRVLWWRGSSIDSHIGVPAEIDHFSAPNLWLVSALVGGEVRLSRGLDVFLHVPLSAVVGGAALTESTLGSSPVSDALGPPAFSGVGATVLVGVQLRLLGGREQGPTYDDLEEPTH